LVIFLFLFLFSALLSLQGCHIFHPTRRCLKGFWNFL
jgi:hypothetical protein